MVKAARAPPDSVCLFLGTLNHHISQHTHESTHYIIVNLLRGEGEEREREGGEGRREISRGTVKIDFSPFAPRTLPFGLEHAQG